MAERRNTSGLDQKLRHALTFDHWWHDTDGD
jgi:hypothetical protein